MELVRPIRSVKTELVFKVGRQVLFQSSVTDVMLYAFAHAVYAPQ